jgi:polyisoprenoid-binding protein YceI
MVVLELASLEHTLAALIAISASVATCNGQPRAIDTGKSILSIRVYKTGIFSTFGHDHDISAQIASGSVDTAAQRVELHVRAAALRVRDANASEKDREEIQKTMTGPEVLDAEQYPEIAFRGTSVEPAGANSWTIHGELTLHGQIRPVSVLVREQDGHYRGASHFRQSEFGMKPLKIAGGTVKVKDEVRVEFEIQLLPSAESKD